MIRIDYKGNGPGGIYGFEPTSKKTAARMRRLCQNATWLGPVMFVEQRYAIEVARGFEKLGEKLLHASTGKKLNTFTGGFTVDADPLPLPRPPTLILLRGGRP